MPIFRSFPDSPSLDQLRRQAKELHAELLRDDDAARQRVMDGHPRAAEVLSDRAKLSDAQLVLAREYGFTSWPALHDYLASPAPQLKDRLKSAIERGDALAVGQLIEAQPLLLQARFAHNDTPLHLAAAGEHPEVVELLIDRGAELTVKNSWAATPLVKALIHGRVANAKRLMSRGAPVSSLVAAAGVGDIASMERFWDDGGALVPGAAELPELLELTPGTWRTRANENARQIMHDALEYACRNGQIAAAEFLLARGADINGAGFFGGTPLHWAAGKGTPEMVRFLARHGGDLQREDPTFHSTPFGWACEDRKLENMRALRELGYRPSVWEAARTGDLPLVQAWVASSRALLDAVRWGTPLAEASAWNQLEVARWLLSEGADAAIPTRDGRLPLALAPNDAMQALLRADLGKRE